MPDEVFQVGDPVLYSGFTSPEVGTITRVHVTRSDNSPEALEVRKYDIKLDQGGDLIRMREHIKPAP